jgi:hypothetical protein
MDGNRDDRNEWIFEATATPEERALARAMESCEVPAMPAGTVEGIQRRVRAAEAARRARIWRGVLALAASVALVAGVWGVHRNGGNSELAAADAEEEFFAEAEEEWISPYEDQFEELETTLLAFEAMDFDSDDTAFPSL